VLTFEATDIDGLWHVASDAHRDERGAFMRLYCPSMFRAAGIAFTSTQINLSTNSSCHTLRGMHWQDPPHAEAKLVRVVAGAIYDVVADLRPESPTYLAWRAFELSEQNGHALLIPEGCAHGFLTLRDETSVLYQMGREYEPGHAKGFRYDDRTFAIDWPADPKVISDADLAWLEFGQRAPA
jgi:dTDP-4-dehydrorhamnose 3,5-epimerase